jgi:type 1 glutamine amidotransferase
MVPLLPLVLTFVPAVQDESELPAVLFFTHSAGFVHDVVKRPAPGELAPAERIFTEMASGRWRVTSSQDCADITPASLADLAAVVFMTTGELPLAPENRQALMDWIARGGAFAGVHCATDTLYEYAPYVAMIGGTFDGHPWHEEVTVRFEDSRYLGAHAAARASKQAEKPYVVTDEIYQFANFRRHPVRVALALDTTSVDVTLGKRPDGDYALAWARDWGEGRVFYCALGHREEVWRDRDFQELLLGGIHWAIQGPDYPARAPKGAQVLLGLDWRPKAPSDLDKWQHAEAKPAAWRPIGEAFEVVPGSGDLVTKEGFGDALYHVEFQTPAMPEASGQARGNSGVYVQSRYEVQVLDSYGLTPGMGDCGSIYGQHVTAVNASRPPERWQSYDIEFTAPRFDTSGAKTANARMSVWHNGIPIHADAELSGPTAGGEAGEVASAPLRLQDHGDRVRYRNVWVLPRVTPAVDR